MVTSLELHLLLVLILLLLLANNAQQAALYVLHHQRRRQLPLHHAQRVSKDSGWTLRPRPVLTVLLALTLLQTAEYARKQASALLAMMDSIESLQQHQQQLTHVSHAWLMATVRHALTLLNVLLAKKASSLILPLKNAVLQHAEPTVSDVKMLTDVLNANQASTCRTELASSALPHPNAPPVSLLLSTT